MKDNSSFTSVSLIQGTPERENGPKFDDLCAKIMQLAACSQEHVVQKLDERDPHIVWPLENGLIDWKWLVDGCPS